MHLNLVAFGKEFFQLADFYQEIIRGGAGAYLHLFCTGAFLREALLFFFSAS